MAESVPVWLVERTYSDDEQNLLIVTYATEDGERMLRKERAMTSFDDARSPVAPREDADESELRPVTDQETREWYKSEVARTQRERT